MAEGVHSEGWNFTKLALLVGSAGAFALGEPLLGATGIAIAFIGPSLKHAVERGGSEGAPETTRTERHKVPYVSTITEYDFT